jgi:hypothetical protein
MENLTTINIALALLGIVIHMLMKIQGRKNKKTTPFDFKKFAHDNLLYTIISLLCTLAILILADVFLQYMSIEKNEHVMELMAFTAGYLNHSLLRNVMKLQQKNNTDN